MSKVNSQATPELRRRLREALPVALRDRDKVTAAVLRSTLAAIENAEAIEPPTTPGSLAIEHTTAGVGTAEAPRRELTEADVERIVRAELAEQEAAAQAFDEAGHPTRAEQLRLGARVLATHLRDPAE